MAYYRTCFNCAESRSSCEARERMKKALAGLSVTSVAFRCQDRKPLFAPGERVQVTWTVIPEDWSYEDGASLESWPATVAQEAGNKFVIKVDDVESDYGTPAREYVKNQNLYCKVSASKLTRLDEPFREFCAKCGEIGGDGFPGCQEINGDGEFPSWSKPHPDCARASPATTPGAPHE